ELACPDGLAFLVEAAGRGPFPPPGLAGDAPRALWFLLRRRRLFDAVFGGIELPHGDPWRQAQAPPGLAVRDPQAIAGTLTADLRQFFADREGAGRFCNIEVAEASGVHRFQARVSGREQVIDAFTTSGECCRRRLLPAVHLAFAYDPSDG